MTDELQPILRKLQVIRNAIAHTNGRLDEQQPARKQELEALAKEGQSIEIWDSHIIVLPEFLIKTTDAAEQLLNKLINFVAQTYPTAAKGAA